MESRIERLCIESGVKMTGQRRVIARVLSDATDHPNVEELYRRATAIDPRISIATVYRTVRLLEEKGILERRDFGEGRARYDPTDRGHHHHLIDVETGKVIEFEDEEHEAVVKRIAARLGFTLVSQRLELFARRQPTEAASDLSRTDAMRQDQAEKATPRGAARKPARPVPVARARRAPPPRGTGQG
ncbi:Fur family transcriptional regulator [Elioraea rosea]|uniref:Fur family transcriptional regulator n=1 Tax=Elioraea rosea TaxID=2492390 RepID=UPI0011870349